MAQDAVAPRTRGADNSRWFRSVVMTIRRLDLLPKTPALGPVRYNVGLVAYVVAMSAATLIVAVISALTVRVPVDLVTCAVAGVTIFLMAVFAVRIAHQANVSWVPTPFIHIGLSVTFGPVGAAVGALAEPMGAAIRIRNGWIRTIFN